MSDDLILRLYAEDDARGLCHMAAREIERLRAVIRINGLRNGATHAEIDAILSPTPPSPGDVP